MRKTGKMLELREKTGAKNRENAELREKTQTVSKVGRGTTERVEGIRTENGYEEDILGKECPMMEKEKLAATGQEKEKKKYCFQGQGHRGRRYKG